jgi:hypothetical protein
VSPRALLRCAALSAGAALLFVANGCGADNGSGPGSGVASVQISAPASSVQVNGTLSFAAVARDASGAVVPGATVSWSSSAAAVATVSPSGTVRGVSVGTTVISASAGGVTSTVSVSVTPDDTPASLTIASTSPVILVSGVSLPLVVTVRAADGHVIASPQVTVTSSDNAVASFLNGAILAGKVGTAVIAVSSGVASASITVQVIVGPPALLVMRTQPAGTTVGVPLTTQPVLEITDRAGNVANAQFPVTASIASGGGTLAGGTTVTTNAGVATFTDLAILGLPGTRVLAFSAPNITSVSSAPFALAASPTPLLVLDSTAVAITVSAGATSPARTITVQNGGSAPLAVTVDPPTYDAGQPTGWLIATLSGAAAPYTLSLQAVATALQPGTYTARVAVRAAGAINSPVVVVVSLTVVPGTVYTFGSSTEKLKVLDAGASYAPALSARDGGGQPVPTGPVTYVSRATTVATVNAQGTITARGEGQTWVVAMGATAADSVHVIVPKNATGPVLRSDATTYLVAANVPTFFNVLLDTRNTAVGAATVVVGYTTATGVFSSVTWTIPSGPPVPVVNSPLGGVIRVSVASATALTGQLTLLRLRVIAPTAGSSGTITLTVTDIVAPDGSDLATMTTSTRIPIVVP